MSASGVLRTHQAAVTQSDDPAAAIPFDLAGWTAVRTASIEDALSRWVSGTPTELAGPAALIAAMRYAVLDGGKRLRPLLVLAASEASGGSAAAALRAACSVELIHAYSLVHDDLPCMDDDVLRRGKPTAHVQFGEATALLAGDALQALAFELLTPDDGAVAPSVQAALCRQLARAAGFGGMAGGQAIDLASVGRALPEHELRAMHRLKTGALLHASVMMGAACGDAEAPALQALSDYGHAIGLAFQIVDDVLDVTADAATLGKTAGKDAAQNKPTFVSLLGLERSRAEALQQLDRAHQALDGSGLPETRALRALADRVVHRTH